MPITFASAREPAGVCATPTALPNNGGTAVDSVGVVVPLSLLAEGASNGASLLPDPESFASVGWLVLSLAALAVALNQGFALWKNVRPRPERGGSVGRAEVEEKIEAIRKDLQNQITEARTYAHDKIHDLTGEFSGFRGLHEARSEGVQNRINALMELVYHMRGQFDQVLAEQRASTAATQRAAVATETAVRLLTDNHAVSAE